MEEKYKVFIRGNKGRGKEVIRALTNLGGNNGLSSLKGDDKNGIYFINHDGEIAYSYSESEIARIIMDNYREIKLWKDGDILIKNDGTCYKIFSRYDPNNTFIFYAYNASISVDGKNIDYAEGVWACSQKDYRIATPKEVKRFYNLLHKNGKNWNAKKKKLVKWQWKPGMNEPYLAITTEGNITDFVWNGSLFDKNVFGFGNCFKTKEEAEIMLEKIKKLLKGE